MVCDKLKKALEAAGAKYEVIPHGEAFTALEVAERTHVKGNMVVKVVMVKSDKGFVMAALPADRRVDIAALREALGLKMAALASEAEFRRLFPDCEPGAMPPFGSLYGIPVYVDSSLALDDEIVFQAGNHYEVVKMSYADYERVAAPTVLSLSKKAA